MPPRIQRPPSTVASILRCKRTPLRSRQYATAAATATPAAGHHQIPNIPDPIARYPPTQPPSFKPPQFRKSQLLRQYASLLRSTPLMLLFQHNNLTATEWVGVRRELTKALQKVDATLVAEGHVSQNIASGVKIQIIQTGIFGAALRVVEYFRPEAQQSGFTHSLSAAAYEAAANQRTAHGLSPLLSGPLVVLSIPTVSPQHLKAALSILAPNQPNFPAPTRKANPGYHDLSCQAGLAKLMLLGARVEGRVFDVEGTRWVGGIPGGLDGLRGQLVNMLQSIGAGVTNTLESASKNLYFTVESRRTMLEDEEKGEAPKA
ncbi:hypothetical protein BP5796_07963 [Coleophoma crateriformis]|uniref:Ribosomal protein YmL11, mitochondrial n=1 Tax=Coleophoma crateriformis TaxID=565419 RepID=A0A3D8RD03_9HELO|nr:hypothetical protein BP5796_07963 [Coleophoma crateriformis]